MRTITQALDISICALIVKVVDTVGADDTFNVGFLSNLRCLGVLSKKDLKSIDQDTLKLALKHRIRFTAHTVSKAGANPPWREELISSK